MTGRTEGQKAYQRAAAREPKPTLKRALKENEKIYLALYRQQVEIEHLKEQLHVMRDTVAHPLRLLRTYAWAALMRPFLKRTNN